MPSVTLICASCKRPFEGRASRLYCSVGCRRSLEFGRRLWHRRAMYTRYLERNANNEFLTKRQRENWRQQFEAAQAKLGPRP